MTVVAVNVRHQRPGICLLYTSGVVPDSIGVFPSPMDVSSIQFRSDQAERDKVSDATGQLYAEAGVSQALLSGSTSGSELETAIRADSGELFRLYRQIERAVNLLLKLRGLSVFPAYRFVFTMLNTTIFNEKDVVERELKLAQASIPNKLRLTAACGINPAALLGNMTVENRILKLGEDWTVLKTSSTQSKEEKQNGRPAKEPDGLSPSGERTRENGTNDPANRVEG